MTCLHCGADVPSGVARCSACAQVLASGGRVAAGLLTTVTGPSPSDGKTDELTRLLDTPARPEPTTALDERTRLESVPPSRASSHSASGAAGFADPGGERPPGSDESDGPLRIGARFGTRYRITRLLGVGGMGAVYEARDAELGVPVALKVIRAEPVSDPGAARELERRFKRELLLARQVTHKNVVRIHDLGEIDGIKYITMPYIEGQDLAHILRAEGRLSVPRALSIARQALSALVAAHAEGIVHRDLKPANIMVDPEGRALLMDFGIARNIGLPADQITVGAHRTTTDAAGDTFVGAIVGTIQYMAPEQAKGGTVDHRADIYAFGLIMRDMLLGLNRRMSAPTALAELQRRLDAPLPPLRSVDPAIPEPLDRLVNRCLAPDAAARYQTAAELEADLSLLDDDGELVPVKRVVGMRILSTIVALLLAVSGGLWWYERSKIPPVQHEPVSVAIADLENLTRDPALDRALEQTLKRALEGASFISAYDRSRIRPTFGVQPPEKWDEAAARQLAIKQGLGVVLSGSIDRQGSGYGISLKAVQAMTGKTIGTARGKASTKEQVVKVATELVPDVRKALGDDTSASAQQFAMVTLSASSLDVVREHAAAMEAQANNRPEDALRGFSKAVELDPKFGMGYQGMASAARNLGRLPEAERYINQALKHLDGMTERERYATRGLFSFLRGDYQGCVKEYNDLVSRYPADALAHNNLAVCLAYLREMRKGMEEQQRAVTILPKLDMYRGNLAMYADYVADFQTAEQTALAVQEPTVKSVLALAYAQVGQGQLSSAVGTYRRLATIDARGASRAASGLGDLARYEGRFSDAVRILTDGARADLGAKFPDRAATKFAALAEARLSQGDRTAAVAAVDSALANSHAVRIRFLVARVLVEAGLIPRGRRLAAELAEEPQAEPRAYAKIIEGDAFLKQGHGSEAIKAFTEANNLFDTWIGHFDLGRGYLSAGASGSGASDPGALVQADAEFDRCIKRRGEALELFLDGEATYGDFPPVYYYKGRVREALGTDNFAQSYRTYLDIRGKAGEDPLLPEVRRRAGHQAVASS
jgi:serine/threonine protein kinase/tetratricopeptide (TPR) repeat protein